MKIIQPVRTWAVALCAVVVAMSFASVRGDEAEQKLPAPVDGPSFVITSIDLRYAEALTGMPDLTEFGDLAVRLHRTDEGWVTPRTSGLRGNKYVMLSRMPLMSEQRYYASAIRAISLGVVKKFSRMGYAGVSVQVDPSQVSPEGKDLRPANDKSLTLVIHVVTVAEVHTIGAGDRVAEDAREDHPAHARIAAGSPVTPNAGQHIDRAALDNYLEWLNRHPGRRVDAAVARGTEPGTVNLDFIVQENKPWFVYFQASNTGTDQTGHWRERFGFVHNQLTGHDDVLSLSYMTGNFEDVHAFVGSYEAPFFPFASIEGMERWRWRVSGSYSEFVASDLGFADTEFSGNSFQVGGEVIWNFYQQEAYFVDAYFGVTWQEVNNETSAGGTTERGEEQFFRSSAGLRMQHVDDTYSTFGSIGVDANHDAIAGTDADEASKLGRENVDDDWVLLLANLSHSHYLDPIIYGKRWDDPSTPASSTLAHEIYMAIAGQRVISDDRLIPQMQQTVGGLYTVRGYRESASVGDNAVYGTFEYRFHVPRVFGVQPEPRQLFGEPFRVARQSTYGRPDWDLVFKGFIDAGRIWHVDPQDGETDRTLVGAGVGVDLSIRNNFSIRVDWARALRSLPGRTSAGSSQVHILATLLY